MRQKVKISLIIKLLFLLLIFILIVSYKIWLPIPGTLLLVKDNLQKADCIMPLKGCYYKYKKTVELYNEGYAKSIVVTVLPDQEEFVKYFYFREKVLGLEEINDREFTLRALEYFGKDSNGVYFTESEVTSTYDEVVAVRDLMLKKGFKSLIVVTSTYHMRRALMIFKLVFRGSGIKIYNCTAKNELYDPTRWWRKEIDVKIVSSEYLSIAFNIFYHFILKKGRTSFDSF